MIRLITKIQLFIISLAVPLFARADAFGLDKAAGKANLKQVSIEVFAANIIQIVLGFVGIIFVLLIIYGGFQWMIGGRDGNEENIKKAKQTISSATIGLVVIVTAYSITYYITTYVLQASANLPATQ